RARDGRGGRAGGHRCDDDGVAGGGNGACRRRRGGRDRSTGWGTLRGGRDRVSTGRVAVGVSGAGSNLRALHTAASRGEMSGEIVLVFADRDCPAIEWAVEQG